MMLIDNYKAFFKEDENEIYCNFRKHFDEYWGNVENEIPSPESPGYISYLKTLEIETKYKYQCLRTMNKQEFLAVMEELASRYENKRLNDKYYDCMKCVFEIKLSNDVLDPHGSAVTLLTNIIDGAFDANVGLTPVQYIKYVIIYLEYYTRKKSVKDKARKGKRAVKEDRERISKYIKKVEKELWYVEDPCIKRFNKIKKAYVKAMS